MQSVNEDSRFGFYITGCLTTTRIHLFKIHFKIIMNNLNSDLSRPNNRVHYFSLRQI